jgi:hypothetical protein
LPVTPTVRLSGLRVATNKRRQDASATALGGEDRAGRPAPRWFLNGIPLRIISQKIIFKKLNLTASATCIHIALVRPTFTPSRVV